MARFSGIGGIRWGRGTERGRMAKTLQVRNAISVTIAHHKCMSSVRAQKMTMKHVEMRRMRPLRASPSFKLVYAEDPQWIEFA